MGDDRPTRYVEHWEESGEEVVVYRASGVGGCVRAMVAAARGVPAQAHQQWFQDVLDEGTRMESAIADMWGEKTGVFDHESQPEVELEVGVIDGRRVIVRGHMDGRTADRIREYKKFRPSTWGAFVTNGVEVNKNYPWQVSVYMHATGLPCDFVGGEYIPPTNMNLMPDGPVVMSPERIASVHGHHYTTAPIPLKDIKIKIAKVERLVNEGYGADEVECSGGYPCPYWFLHDKVEKPEIELDAWWAEKLLQWDEAILEIAKAKDHVKKLEGNKKSLGNAITERLVKAGLSAGEGGSFKVGDYTVTRVKSTVAERVQTVKSYELDYVKVTGKK